MADSRVIILIITHKDEVSINERESLKQCFRILGSYPIRLICPEGLNIENYRRVVRGIEVSYIDPRWQSTYEKFNRLKIAPLLYKMFSEYEFILFYELDAWVFEDRLAFWCDQNYDFIGAPWFGKAENTGKPEFRQGQNGGFSLRKISSHLKVVNSYQRLFSRSEIWNWYKQFNILGKITRLPQLIMQFAGIFNNSYFRLNRFDRHEDLFWSVYVPRVFKWFSVPQPQTALEFSFERNPGYLFNLNHNQLPFGCHAWAKHDISFWRQFIKIDTDPVSK